MGSDTVNVSGDHFNAAVRLQEIYEWEPGSPNLYDLDLILNAENGGCDKIRSFFGMRSIVLKDGAIHLNGKPLFQRLVLDQGFYPDGIYTAPSDEALKKDIEISMAVGFNGARLHQKVFEPRFLYWADKLGYLVWGEHASWGLDLSNPAALERFLPEWLEVVERDYNHPAIVGWCPFNETNNRQNTEVLRTVYNVTKKLDATRPVIDTSGFVHVITDIFSIHNYIQEPDDFAKQNERVLAGEGRTISGLTIISTRGSPSRLLNMEASGGVRIRMILMAGDMARGRRMNRNSWIVIKDAPSQCSAIQEYVPSAIHSFMILNRKLTVCILTRECLNLILKSSGK
jgi:beta-galactosidase/beta-glucuronidase